MDTELSNSEDKITCPRCLGKGYVDWADIRRLNKGYIWSAGSCAYCGGSGIVAQAKLLTHDVADSAIVNETPTPLTTFAAQQQIHKYTLPCFGEVTLNVLEKIYEAELDYNGDTIELDLNFDENEIAGVELFGVVDVVENFSTIADMARNAIIADFEAGGVVREYIDHHVDLLDGEELSELLDEADGSLSVERQILSVLTLYRVGFYPEYLDHTIMDYTIGDDFTDYLIVLTLDDKGNVDTIEMES